jgi:hypothetical protein
VGHQVLQRLGVRRLWPGLSTWKLLPSATSATPEPMLHSARSGQSSFEVVVDGHSVSWDRPRSSHQSTRNPWPLPADACGFDPPAASFADVCRTSNPRPASQSTIRS